MNVRRGVLTLAIKDRGDVSVVERRDGRVES